jgi:hypothetical protein
MLVMVPPNAKLVITYDITLHITLYAHHTLYSVQYMWLMVIIILMQLDLTGIKSEPAPCWR